MKPFFTERSLPCRNLLPILLLVLGMFWFGCNKPAPPPVAPSAPKESPSTPANPPGATSSAPSTQTTAHLQAVDLEGHPLSGMMPIATWQPNAFDKPFSEGALTDANGMGTVVVPSNKRSFVRIWDPSLRLFANNYLEVQEGEAAETDLMQVQLVTGATFELVLHGNDDKPISGTAVSMMMVHPKVGPWWPGEGMTDVNGKVSFGPVPAGKFNILLQTETKGKAEINEALFMPGEKSNLGTIRLQPQAQQ